MSKAVAVQLEDVTFTYDGQPAVEDISLDIRPGELVVLVGPSGCGKSTLLKLVAGLITPDHGRLLINDREMQNTPPERRDIGWVPQSYALFEHLDVSQNIAFGLRMRGVSRADQQKRIDRMLDLCQISELARRSVSDLSGGQRQRVAIARALAIQPQVMLLDEPLAALDPQLRLRLRGDLEAILRETGITTIFVTHDQEEALALADRVAVLKAGQLVQFDTPENLWRKPATAFTAAFIGNATVAQTKRLDLHRLEVVPGLEIAHPGDDEPQVALRVGDLCISPNGHGAQLTVQSVEFAGDRYRVVGLTEQDVQLRLLTDVRVGVGASLCITLCTDREPVLIHDAR